MTLVQVPHHSVTILIERNLLGATGQMLQSHESNGTCRTKDDESRDIDDRGDSSCKLGQHTRKIGDSAAGIKEHFEMKFSSHASRKELVVVPRTANPDTDALGIH